MNGNRLLIDSNVIILASKRKLDFEAIFGGYDEVYVSIVSYMEVFGYPFKQQQEFELITRIFENLQIVDVNLTIANHVVGYRKSDTKKIKLPDAIILASARFLQADLLTFDRDDFINIDQSVKILEI